MDEMRKAFEAHCARNWIDTECVMDGPYKDASTQRAWEAWQAATLAERERCIRVCDERAFAEQKNKEWLRSGGATACGNDIAKG